MPRAGFSTGKLDRPGPDAPGDRIEATCAICGETFWPRRRDVERGGGRHCSRNCSSKAFTRFGCAKCGKVSCIDKADVKRHGRRFCSETCAQSWKPYTKPQPMCVRCGKAITADIQHCSTCRNALGLEIEHEQRYLSQAGYSRRIGRSRDSIRRAIRSGRLRSAWDGKLIDSEHPDAVAFAQSEPHKLASRAVTERERRVDIGGESFTLQELQRISGISYGLLYKRIVKLGMPPLEAVSIPMKRYAQKYNFNGKTMTEWAALLGVTEQTIRNRMTRRKVTFADVVEEALRRLEGS